MDLTHTTTVQAIAVMTTAMASNPTRVKDTATTMAVAEGMTATTTK